MSIIILWAMKIQFGKLKIPQQILAHLLKLYGGWEVFTGVFRKVFNSRKRLQDFSVFLYYLTKSPCNAVHLDQQFYFNSKLIN